MLPRDRSNSAAFSAGGSWGLRNVATVWDLGFGGCSTALLSLKFTFPLVLAQLGCCPLSEGASTATQRFMAESASLRRRENAVLKLLRPQAFLMEQKLPVFITSGPFLQLLATNNKPSQRAVVMDLVANSCSPAASARLTVFRLQRALILK